jgi:hypothetical protein
MTIIDIMRGGQLRQHKGKITLAVAAIAAGAAYLTGEMTLTEMLQQVLPALLSLQ